MEENKGKATIFISSKYKGLELVCTPMGLKDPQGNNVKSKRCMFAPSKYGYSFATEDKELADWLRKHEYFKTGLILEYDHKMAVSPAEGQQVSRGGVSTESGKDQAEAPKSEQPKPGAARVK